MSAIVSASVYTLKFVNSFARRQHLFDVVAKHQLTSIRIFCRILLSCPCWNPFSILAEWHTERCSYEWK